MRGGAEHYAKELAEYMMQKHEVHVICGFGHSQEDAGYEIHKVNSGWYLDSPVTFRNYFNPTNASEIRYLLRDINPDIIHLHNVARLGLTFLPREVPTVQTVHDFWYFCPRSDLLDFSGKLCNNSYRGSKCVFCKRDCVPFMTDVLRNNLIINFLQGVRLFIFPSRTTQETFVQRNQAFKRSVVIYNGIRIGEPPKTYSAANPLRALFVGRLSREKGVDYLVRAVEDLENVCLDVVGVGESERKIRTYVHSRHIKNVVMHGFVSEEEKWSFYEKSDVVVIPSLWPEVAPLVAIEAMSKGRVVLVTNLGGAHEFVDDGVTGFIIKPNAAAIRDRLAYLVENPEITEEMKRKARKKAEDFRFEDHASRIEKCYEALLEDRRL